MIRTLRARLMLNILLPILIIVPMVAWVLAYLLQTQVFVAGIANELIRQAVLVADMTTIQMEIWRDPNQAQIFVTRISPRLTAKLMLLDPQGRLIVSSDPGDAQFIGKAYDMPDMQRLLEMETPVEVRYKQSQLEDVTVPVVDSTGKVLGLVRLMNPLAGIYVRSEQLGRLTLIVTAGGILIGVVMGLLLARDVEHPLKKTSQAVYDLANQQMIYLPLKEEGPVEIQRLIHAFNLLAERLKTSEETRRRLLANMVHELGRPLGAFLSAIQALRAGATEQPELREELLEGMQGEVQVLQHLLDDLAHLDQEGRTPELRRQEIDPAAWLPVVIRTWMEEAAQKGVMITQAIAGDLPVISVDPDKLAQAVGNLISNAIRYTPSGGNITVSALTENNHLKIQVADNGPGIAEEEQERIFQPFYRGKAARRFSDGMGLGLTIARDLVHAHGGNLLLQSEPGKGSTFTIQIPLTPHSS